MYVCICVCEVCVNACIRVYVYVCMCVLVYVRYVCVSVFVCACVYVCVWVCMIVFLSDSNQRDVPLGDYRFTGLFPRSPLCHCRPRSIVSAKRRCRAGPFRSVLQCCSVLYCVAWCWIALQHIAVCCSVMQCVAACGCSRNTRTALNSRYTHKHTPPPPRAPPPPTYTPTPRLSPVLTPVVLS